MVGKGVRVALAVSGLIALATAAEAQERVTLGWGRMFSNDAIGDGHDRWRTGSYTVSYMRGPSWDGDLPTQVGEILEFRASGQTIAPANLADPAPDDRRYAGILTFGLHTHFDWLGLETSVGADLDFTGPQTGLSSFQERVHDWTDLPDPEPAFENQIPNHIYLTAIGEMGKEFQMGDAGRVRPFVEAQAGIETFVRAGADLTFGGFGEGSLLVREYMTGQRYRAIKGDLITGTSFTLGGDIAHVFDSALLPEGGAAELSSTRARARAGIQWQGERASVFYGISYLGEEFVQQPEGQVVGSLNINFRF
ncbi:lipid A-modifier LpxR family protein [Neotabrizicola shimadae]|uniref:DUF2219 family protein n=1 Tax=Neotabrizicola shimadae TaxID=2807096 RepID=A0A8G0ZUM2_9RHOB|nr:lipid A-modifier LpxR family protein [Neotabrizicola shimadae]QYZ70367.1 DUF2219 family protein [Neotabrizicola shimadae]